MLKMYVYSFEDYPNVNRAPHIVLDPCSSFYSPICTTQTIRAKKLKRHVFNTICLNEEREKKKKERKKETWPHLFLSAEL